MQLERLLVDRLEAEKHVVKPELRPALEDLLVPDEDVAPRLEVVLLLDAASLDLVGDLHSALGIDERDVVDDEDVGLADAREVLRRALGRELPVASTVEGPRAAEGAVPRTAARELDRCARIEVADEVLLPSPHQIASRR